MKISAITVCWNASKTIRYTVESFLAQDYANKEMILVDGVSSDGTVEIVKSYNSSLIKIHSSKDKGIYDAMNKGLTLYAGDAVGFLNADDAYHNSKCLSLIADGLKAHSIVSGWVDMVTDHKTRHVSRTWQPAPYKPGAFQTGWMPPHPTTYAKRAVYDKVGGFDISYKISADYDWMIRAFEIDKFDNAMIDQILIDMQLGGMSTSGPKAAFTNLFETSRARRKWLGAGPVDRAMMAKIWGRVSRTVRSLSG